MNGAVLPSSPMPPAIQEKPMTAAEIKDALSQLSRWGGIFIPEFTFRDLRIDAIIIDTNKRWIRGFEIKVNRSDFIADDKWGLYSRFCSSLAIVCPADMIQPAEVPDPFGLLYVRRSRFGSYFEVEWKKKIKRFQRRDAMAWMWTYFEVLEAELPRLAYENKLLRPSKEHP